MVETKPYFQICLFQCDRQKAKGARHERPRQTMLIYTQMVLTEQGLCTCFETLSVEEYMQFAKGAGSALNTKPTQRSVEQNLLKHNEWSCDK